MPVKQYWRVPRLWPDSTVFIIGGGPSLKNMDLTPIHDRRIIGANNAFMLGDWVDVCFFVDHVWWMDNYKSRDGRMGLDDFPGMKIHCCNRSKIRPGTARIQRGKALGIERESHLIAWNRNSGAGAINLAYHFGAKRVVLLGFDMKFGPDGENNWHDWHRPKPKTWKPHQRHIESFGPIKKDADELGLEILNATPDSALKLFPMVRLEDIL